MKSNNYSRLEELMITKTYLKLCNNYNPYENETDALIEQGIQQCKARISAEENILKGGE